MTPPKKQAGAAMTSGNPRHSRDRYDVWTDAPRGDRRSWWLLATDLSPTDFYALKRVFEGAGWNIRCEDHDSQRPKWLRDWLPRPRPHVPTAD